MCSSTFPLLSLSLSPLSSFHLQMCVGKNMEESQALENYADDIDHKAAATAPVIFPGSAAEMETRGQLARWWGGGSLFFNAYDVDVCRMDPVSFERCSFPFCFLSERTLLVHPRLPISGWSFTSLRTVRVVRRRFCFWSHSERPATDGGRWLVVGGRSQASGNDCFSEMIHSMVFQVELV